MSGLEGFLLGTCTGALIPILAYLWMGRER